LRIGEEGGFIYPRKVRSPDLIWGSLVYKVVVVVVVVMMIFSTRLSSDMSLRENFPVQLRKFDEGEGWV
jgi:hypothetical protein